MSFLFKSTFCEVMGAIDADASGSIGWTEFMAAILLTQALTKKCSWRSFCLFYKDFEAEIALPNSH